MKFSLRSLFFLTLVGAGNVGMVSGVSSANETALVYGAILAVLSSIALIVSVWHDERDLPGK